MANLQTFKRIPLFKVFLAPRDALLPKISETLYSGMISEGEPVFAFEKAFETWIGCEKALSFYSGTAALHTALLLAGVAQGDEVISTPLTAEPTNMAILHSGARIVWADVDPLNGNLSPSSIAEHITGRTKAIMVVHYGGIPASIAAIRRLAEANGLPVIEDAAHALGARHGGKPIGTHSEYVVFSFQAIKHMTTVDGGMLACRRSEDAARGRIIRWFGIDRSARRTDVDVKDVGYKYHMNNLNATIGLVQLQHIGPIVRQHIDNGAYFNAALKGIPGLRTCVWDSDAEPTYWFYTVLAERRDDLSRALASKGIESSIVHRRNDWHSVFANSRAELPHLDSFYSQMLHIPCGWWVSEEDRLHIANSIREGW